MRSHRDTLLSWLRNERETERKQRLRAAISGNFDAIQAIFSAYMCKLTAESLAVNTKSRLEQTCDMLERVVSALANFSPATAASGSTPSFADITARNKPSAPSNALSSSVSLGRGATFPVRALERVVIGPCEAAIANFESSSVTKDVVLKSIDPVATKMRPRLVMFGPSCSVIIKGEGINVNALANCTALSEAGLEIKNDLKISPRLIIHDIPIGLSADAIVYCIAKQNFTDVPIEEFKVIYMYPARNKKFRSCIIETKPEHIISLLNRRTVNINWVVCRIAKDCEKKACCRKCASEHPTQTCNTKNLKCVNCLSAKYTNVNHAATDKNRCPILRNKIDLKISSINYGE